MICYRDTSYCADASICPVKETECSRILTEREANRAAIFGLPIAWMEFKDICIQYKEATSDNRQSN